MGDVRRRGNWYDREPDMAAEPAGIGPELRITVGRWSVVTSTAAARRFADLLYAQCDRAEELAACVRVVVR